jgi:hypothetical protein
MRPRLAKIALLLLGLCVGPVALAQPTVGTHGVCDLKDYDNCYAPGVRIINGGRNGNVVIYCNHGFRDGTLMGGGPGLPLLDGRPGSVRFYAVCHSGNSGLIQAEANRTGMPCIGPNGLMHAETGQVFRKRLCLFDSSMPGWGPYWDEVEVPRDRAYSRCMPGGTPQPCANALGCLKPGTLREPDPPRSYGPNWPAPWNRPPGSPGNNGCIGTCRTNLDGDGPLVTLGGGPGPGGPRPRPGFQFPSFRPTPDGALNGLGMAGTGLECIDRSMVNLNRGCDQLGEGNWEGFANLGIGGGGTLAGSGFVLGGGGMALGGSGGAALTSAGAACLPAAACVATAGVGLYVGSEISTATGLDTVLGSGMCGAYDTVAVIWRWEFDYSLTSACWTGGGDTRPRPVSNACNGGSRQRVDPPFRGRAPTDSPSGGCGAAPGEGPPGDAGFALFLLCGVVLGLRGRPRARG